MKNIYLFALALFALSTTACSDDNNSTPGSEPPVVTLTEGEAAQTTLSFTINPSNAETCSYVYVQEGETLPDADEVLASGTKAEATKPSTVTISDLEPETNYIILAAVAGEGGKAISEPLPMTTLERETNVSFKTISFEACEFSDKRTDNIADSGTENSYDEFGAKFVHYNYYTMVGGVFISSKAEMPANADSTPGAATVAGDEKSETTGADGSAKFAVFSKDAYVENYDASFSFGEGVTHKILSAKVNNSARTYQYLKYGFYSKRGLKADEYCEAVFTGYDAKGEKTGSTAFALADFRSGKSFVCSEWIEVDLSALGEVNKVTVTLNLVANAEEIHLSTDAFSLCVDEIKFELPAE